MLNTNVLTYDATVALLKLSKTFVCTDEHMGRCQESF